MKKIILLFLFLSACSKSITNHKNNDNFDIENMNLKEFSNRLKVYVNTNPFPDIEK